MQPSSVLLLALGTSIVAGKSFLSQRPLPTEVTAYLACSEHESPIFCAKVPNIEVEDVASMAVADTALTLPASASVAPSAATATATSIVLDVFNTDDGEDDEDYYPFDCPGVGKPPVCHHPHHTRHNPYVITLKRDVATTTGAGAAATSAAVDERDDSSVMGHFPDECYAIDRPGYCDEWIRTHGLPVLPEEEKEGSAAETAAVEAREARVPEMITHGLPRVVPTTLVTMIVREENAPTTSTT